MRDISELMEAHPEGEVEERFRFECAGGAVTVAAAQDRLTPYGGAAAWSHYLEKLGVVADLARRFPLARTSPNATPVADIVQAFMFNCLMAGRRFAHARRVQDDRALALILGMQKGRLCGEDAFYHMMAKVPRERARAWLAWHETAGVPRPCDLFKLKLTANVRRAIARVPWPEWEGRPRVGMEQYAETRVRLEGWSCERRVIVTRTLKPANPSPQDVFWGADEEEFCAYVTNLEPQQATPAQIVLTHRKRADAENVFDELKNQWSFDGFCSGKGVVSETAARLLLLTYNLWSLFVRVLKEEGCYREAITSRDDLLVMPAKLVESGRQKTLKLSICEKWWSAISRASQRLQRWLASIAPQLQPQQTFERYLCWFNPSSPDDWLPQSSP